MILGFAISLIMPGTVLADGCFLAGPWVWNKHKDINEPTQKAILVHDAGREDLILQVKYDGPVEEFGWLIPVPGLPTVRKGSMSCFYELSRYTQARWEQNAVPGTLGAAHAGAGESEAVKVIEIKTVGAYEVAVLSPKDAGSLENWLMENHFTFPKERTDVIDGYVRQNWYFVAIKIRLGAGNGFRLVTGSPKQPTGTKPFGVAEKLAKGELQPLDISFDTPRCVFPLKISSINGSASEVQVYVLSREPLVEKGMFEQKFPKARQYQMNAERERAEGLRRNAEGGGYVAPDEVNSLRARWNLVDWPDVVRYASVGKADLPECTKHIPRLGEGSWWLMKQTWVFKPEQMHDLEFQPAIPVFVNDLAGEEGYFAAANLDDLGSTATPALLAALRSPNPTVRIHAASIVGKMADAGPVPVPQIVSMLKDEEPEVRLGGAMVAWKAWNPALVEPLIGLFRDTNDEVRIEATQTLSQHTVDASNYVPLFQKMLKEDSPGVKASALRMLVNSKAMFSREEKLGFCAVPQEEVVGMGIYLLSNEGITADEAVPMLHNPERGARAFGLVVLADNDNKQSVDLALPLLTDPDRNVKQRAGHLLRALTGQSIPLDQPDQWQKWWNENRATFEVKKLHRNGA